MQIPVLPFHKMEERHIGLTKAIADCFTEAARVCLDRNHLSPQEFYLHSDTMERRAVVEWEPPDERCKRAWANKNDATRDGAYACALAATKLCLGFFAIRRAETLTGADYYVGPGEQSTQDLEDCFRLEVSGTDLDSYEVQRRLNAKVRQASLGKSNLPAIAAVVGFRVKLLMMQTLNVV